MALALAAQLPRVASFSVDSTLNDELKADRLHKYRVALRRIKTLLIASESVFPPLLAESALTLVSAELRHTAEARNLDVVAESLDLWSDAMSPELRGGLKKIVAKVERRRDLSYTDVREMLERPDHLAMVDQLRNLGTVYRLGGEEPGRDVLVSARKVARNAFADAWAGVESAGEKAVGSADTGDWHRLRRRLKRVAYLLDAFGPILIDAAESDDHAGARSGVRPGVNAGVNAAGHATAKVQADVIAKVAKQVAKLQRDLGDLQDMVVEVDLLSDLAAGLGTKATMVAGVIVNSDQMEIPRKMRRCAKRWKKLHQIASI